MTAYVEQTGEVEIPKATGVEGYLSALEKLLKKARVQRIEIVPGKISWRRFRKEEEPEDLTDVGIDLPTLAPAAVIRRSDVREITIANAVQPAAVLVLKLLNLVNREGYFPIAFVSGVASKVHAWHRACGVELPSDSMYGLPLYLDADIPAEVLVVCASFGRSMSLIDTARTYKIVIPWSAL